MATGVRSRYNVAIDGKGYMLRGAPSAPRYVKQDAPTLLGSIYIQREAGIVDPSSNQFTGSGWNYWPQTDWSGGFQVLKFKDDGSFKDGQGVEVLKKYGQVTLQYGWTSAAQISGSHSYGAHSVHDNDLLFGTIKNAGAKIFKLTSGSTLSTLSAMSTISAVNTMARFGNNTLIGLTKQTAASASVKSLVKYNGSTISGFRSANPVVRSVASIGIRAYTGELVKSLSGDVLYYSTDLSTFTSAYQAGKNRKIIKIFDVSGSPYFLISQGNVVELNRWDEFAERAYPIYTWDNLTNVGVSKYVSLTMITGKSNGKSVAFAFNGAQIKPVFDDQLQDSSYDFSKPFQCDDNFQVKGATWDGSVWAPGIYGKLSGTVVTPFVNFGNRAYGYAQPTSAKIFLGYRDTTKYNVSGFIESSEFGGSLGSVDKLVNSVDINMNTLTTSQTIEVFKSTDAGASFSSIGKAQFSQDGAINKKTLYFPSGFVTRLWEYKVVLVGATGLSPSTPTLQDLSFQFRPIPDLRKRWTLSLDAGNDIKLLNQKEEQQDGKALIQSLWNKLEAKKTIVYEDVDAFEVNLVSAMTAAQTSAIVNSTRLMPPQGRVRVLKSNQIEEMSYTSADGGVIKGISRGQKHTLARAYTSADKMDNFYNVLITNIREQVNDTDQKTTESIAQVVLLEV